MTGTVDISTVGANLAFPLNIVELAGRAAELGEHRPLQMPAGLLTKHCYSLLAVNQRLCHPQHEIFLYVGPSPSP